MHQPILTLTKKKRGHVLRYEVTRICDLYALEAYLDGHPVRVSTLFKTPEDAIKRARNWQKRGVSKPKQCGGLGR
jgi:hypothetical protein